MKKIKEKLLNREVILYIVFGIITTLTNVGLFYTLNKIGIEYIVANLIALITAKTVAYLTNKFFVFRKRCKNKKELFREIVSFVICRSLSFLIDFIGLIILVEVFNVEKIIGKIVLTIIVIIVNYFASKKIVFK